jgi:hypothetical protein
MKTKQTTREPSRQDSGVYLSIVAKDHDEMCRKVAKLHADLNGEPNKGRKSR